MSKVISYKWNNLGILNVVVNNKNLWKIIADFLAYLRKNLYLCINMQQGHKRLKITAWPCRKFFLVHEEVQHGVAVKTRNQGIGFKE